MEMKTLGEALGAAGAAAAQTMNETPFLPGRGCVACIEVSANFNGTIAVEGSDDGTTYTALASVAGTNQPNKKARVAVKKYMRANMTAWTAGTANAYVLGDN